MSHGKQTYMGMTSRVRVPRSAYHQAGKFYEFPEPTVSIAREQTRHWPQRTGFRTVSGVITAGTASGLKPRLTQDAAPVRRRLAGLLTGPRHPEPPVRATPVSGVRPGSASHPAVRAGAVGVFTRCEAGAAGRDRPSTPPNGRP